MSTCLLATPPRVYNLATRTTTRVVAKMGKKTILAAIMNITRMISTMTLSVMNVMDVTQAAVYEHLPLQATISAPKTQSGFSASTPHLIFAFFCT